MEPSHTTMKLSSSKTDLHDLEKVARNYSRERVGQKKEFEGGGRFLYNTEISEDKRASTGYTKTRGV